MFPSFIPMYGGVPAMPPGASDSAHASTAEASGEAEVNKECILYPGLDRAQALARLRWRTVRTLYKMPGAEPCALPVPNGASVYNGWMQISTKGDTKKYPLILRVMCYGEAWGGEWEFGGYPGQRESVQIEMLGRTEMRIHNTEGRNQTSLHGTSTRGGRIFGTVQHRGLKGGSFSLRAVSGFEQPGCLGVRAPQWLQAVRTTLNEKRCEKVDIQHPSIDLPDACAICLEGFEPGDMVNRTTCTDGGHVFHTACFGEWAKGHNTCPVCRRGLRNVHPIPAKTEVDAHVQAAMASAIAARIGRM